MANKHLFKQGLYLLNIWVLFCVSRKFIVKRKNMHTFWQYEKKDTNEHVIVLLNSQ